jgi:hypothetical protein
MTLVANSQPVTTTPAAKLPLVSTTQAENFATGTAGVVDTGGKFATGVNNTGGNTLSCEYLREFSKI